MCRAKTFGIWSLKLGVSVQRSVRLTEFLKACQSFVEHVKCGAVAQTDAVVVSERDARYGGYAVAVQKFVAEVD